MTHQSHGSFLMLAALLAAVTIGVQAGDYRNGHTRPVRDPATLYHNYEPTVPLMRSELPKEFNWCQKDGLDLCTASWNQHIPTYCGSCYLHGTLSAIQDRLKIKKKGVGIDVMLARQTFMNCAAFHKYGAGCNGGDPIDVFHYMHKFGLPDESCQLYNATDHTKYDGAKECPPIAKCMNCMPVKGKDTCWPVETPILYKLKSYGKLKHADELGMMTEIKKNGPITCSIATPDSFVYQYRSGIALASDYNKTEVDHDVEVVGWGEEKGTPFWHIRNSWGTFWGELGFFRLERGTNALRIEEGDCWVGEPEFEMEKEVESGELEGSMYGLVDRKDAVEAEAAELLPATASSAAGSAQAKAARKAGPFVAVV